MRPHADLPLHYGKVPAWLAQRMSKLGRGIVQAMVIEYGRGYFLERLADPCWFQAFGCVLGMDWHSSGITTSVMGALKGGLNPISQELGIYICGGRGRQSRKTPQELMQIGERTGLDAHALVRASRLTAKIDNNALADGFQIYLHNFVLTREGKWVVIQQGLNDRNGYARRYHWHSEHFKSYLENPHSSIIGKHQGLILNLVHEEARAAQSGMLSLAGEAPERVIREVKKMFLPAHHDVRLEQVNIKRLGTVLALAQERNIPGFEDLLLLPTLGPRTLQSLALVSEIIHGHPTRFSDPARFSFAHGGKDGHPFPVPTKVYDEVIDRLDRSIQKAKLDESDKLQALKSLHQLSKKMEPDFKPNEKLDDLIAEEWAQSNKWGGRTVFDNASRKKKSKKPGQLTLFPDAKTYI